MNYQIFIMTYFEYLLILFCQKRKQTHSGKTTSAGFYVWRVASLQLPKTLRAELWRTCFFTFGSSQCNLDPSGGNRLAEVWGMRAFLVTKHTKNIKNLQNLFAQCFFCIPLEFHYAVGLRNRNGPPPPSGGAVPPEPQWATAAAGPEAVCREAQ